MIVVLLKKLYIEIPVLKTRIDCPLWFWCGYTTTSFRASESFRRVF